MAAKCHSIKKALQPGFGCGRIRKVRYPNTEHTI